MAATDDIGPTAAKRGRVVYDRLAPGYDSAMRPLERWYLARLRSVALAELPVGGRILEIGAGTGINFPFYPRAVTFGVASELSSAMIRIASGKQKAGHVHLVQNSAEQLPFRDASFDAAFATLVFCSVASPREAFAELRRVVRPGGNVTLLEHVRPDGMLLGPLFDALSILTVAVFDDHFNRRTAEEARHAGLQTVRVRKYAFGIIQLIECRV
ncbi:MAG TPA: methyltransferase domain-containing protein [Pyrinomonadaceae bacterium]|nr:methyltransferase domain-containing protein [Pyrinomonadaceae bacterium]